MKRTTSAKDIKQMAALRQENAELRTDARELAGRAVRAEREARWAELRREAGR